MKSVRLHSQQSLGEEVQERTPGGSRLGYVIYNRHQTGPSIERQEWASLKKDDRVVVRRDAGPTTAGSVDVVADDGSVFWVHLDHGHGRVAIHAEDEVSVWWA